MLTRVMPGLSGTFTFLHACSASARRKELFYSTVPGTRNASEFLVYNQVLSKIRVFLVFSATPKPLYLQAFFFSSHTNSGSITLLKYILQ